jgi:8-amino-7-oxononanoate synthase
LVDILLHRVVACAAVPLTGIDEELGRLERSGLLRTPRVLASADGPVCTIDGREVVLLCSNDYLGLSAHPAVRRAVVRSVEGQPVGACSSRLVSGTRASHRVLEEQLAGWLGVERTLLVSTGFMANLAVMTTLAGPDDVVFSDELNHASIVQGCRLSRARIEVFPHCDMDALERGLSRARRARRRLVVTESIFSVDGDEAPLADMWRLARTAGAALVVDEAHALGVLGPQGRGLCAAAGFVPDVIVGTLGKAFGVMGAFIAGTTDVVRLHETRATAFIYTTAPPPLVAEAALAALEVVRRADEERGRVLTLATRLRAGIERLGCVTGAGHAHIVPQLVPDISRALDVSLALLERGVFVQVLRPPTVPAGTERLRWSPTALHSSTHIDRALEALGEVLG